MENAADALKMAAAILIFIIAIASSFSLFGTAKQTADSIIGVRDKQAYLEAAEEDVGGILYTSSSSIIGNNAEDSITTEYVSGITKNGDRIVKIDDVISTIYRYPKEKYGVTIIDKSSNKVIARFDSNTENFMRQWYNIVDGYNSENKYITSEEQRTKYKEQIEKNIYTKYCEEPTIDLATLYEVNTSENSKINCGAPWYGNEEDIKTRINIDLAGGSHSFNGQTYKGKSLLKILNEKKIIEVTNEIDQSKYLSDTQESIQTNLLQQYQMPTVEIIYIFY